MLTLAFGSEVLNLATEQGRIDAKKKRRELYNQIEGWDVLKRFDYLQSRGWVRVSKEPTSNSVICWWQDPGGLVPVPQHFALSRQIWRDMWAAGILTS